VVRSLRPGAYAGPVDEDNAKRQHLQPRRRRRRGATGARVPTPQPWMGRLPARKGVAFRHPRPAIFRPAASAAAHYGQLVWPRSSTAPWAPGSDAIADARQGPTQRASWISGHPSFQDAGRLHVNVGWRHPRPVAANDARIVSGSLGRPGIGAAAGAVRHLPTAL